MTTFSFLSNFITKGYRSSHNEVAASAWRQQNADWWSEMKNADWWSEMKKTNTNIRHHENYSTTSCRPMDSETDDEAAG